MYSIWKQHASYIPFPRPIPTPDVSVLGTPQMSICFHESWLPAVLGALKALARQETWNEVGMTVDSAVDEARTLIARAGENCLQPEPDGINWELQLLNFSGQLNSWSQVGGGPPNNTFTQYEGTFDLPDVFGSVDAMVEGVDYADNDLKVGGLVSSFTIEKNGGMEGVYTAILKDCFGRAQTETGFTPVTYSNKLLKSVRVLSLINLKITCRIEGVWQCGPA